MNNFAKKQKVLILFSDAQYIRNYGESGNLERLLDIFELHIAVKADLQTDLQNIAINLEDKGAIIYAYTPYSRECTKLHQQLFDALMWIERMKSISFRYRIMRGIIADVCSQCFIGKYNSLTSNDVIKEFDSKVPVNRQLIDLVKQVNAKYVIIPSAAYEAEANDIIRSFPPTGSTKVVLAVDNWDNLSSKTLLPWKPAAITCLGPQSAEHAIRIHSIDNACVFPIGTPRFDVYTRDSHTDDCRSIYTRQTLHYILYLGGSLQHAELDYLSIANDAVRYLNTKLGADIAIVYKPHPAKPCQSERDLARIVQLENVKFDKNSLPSYAASIPYYPRRALPGMFPELSGYQGLISKSLFVISGLSTMILEALICGREVVLPLIEEPGNLTSNAKAFKAYEHFRGLDSLEGVTIASTRDNLYRKIISMAAKDALCSQPITKGKSNFNGLHYYVYFDSRLWADRLCEILKRIE